jgi:hypothetical protein
MEIQIIPAVEEQKEGLIKWNHAFIKTELAKFLSKYEGYEVSEDTLAEDKKTRAELNKVTKGIDDFRKTVKSELLAPIDFFEGQCKELTGMVSDVSSKIDEKVKEFETKKKEEKRILAQEVIDSIKSEYQLPENYSMKVELKESFCNLSTSKTQIEQDIRTQLDTLKSEYDTYLERVKTIEASVEEANKKLIVKLNAQDFVEKLNYKELSQVIVDISNRAEDIYKTENQKPVEKPIEIPVVEKETEKVEIMTFTIEVSGTLKQLQALKDFLLTNNINYTKK